MIRSTLASFANSITIPARKRSGPLTFTPNRVKVELLAGLTVALALVPEAVAFAFVAGVEPLVGLYAAFIVGLITAIIGGRPGMISGATGALAVVMVALVADHGVEYLFATVVLMGINCAGFDVDIMSPNRVEKLLAREDLTGPAHEMLEQTKFCWAEMDFFLRARDVVSFGVNLQLSNNDGV